MSDEELVERIRAGDEGAAEDLVKRYYADILRFCRWHSANLESAEDMAQETFFRVFRSLMKYEDRGRFHAWIYTIARRVCIDESRKPRFQYLAEDEEVGVECSGIEQFENQDEIRCLLAKLPPEQAEAILLYYEEKLTYKEIGRMLGIPARTVQSRVKSGIRKIREWRKKHEG